MKGYDAMYKFLIVDDSFYTLTYHTALITAAGHQAMVAENGPEALRIYQTDHPDIVLCDIMMPEMDGLEVFAELKNYDPKIVLYFITAENTGYIHEKALSMNPTGFFQKPIEIATIRQMLIAYEKRKQ